MGIEEKKIVVHTPVVRVACKESVMCDGGLERVCNDCRVSKGKDTHKAETKRARIEPVPSLLILFKEDLQWFSGRSGVRGGDGG